MNEVLSFTDSARDTHLSSLAFAVVNGARRMLGGYVITSLCTSFTFLVTLPLQVLIFAPKYSNTFVNFFSYSFVASKASFSLFFYTLLRPPPPPHQHTSDVTDSVAEVGLKTSFLVCRKRKTGSRLSPTTSTCPGAGAASLYPPLSGRSGAYGQVRWYTCAAAPRAGAGSGVALFTCCFESVEPVEICHPDKKPPRDVVLKWC